MSALNKVFVLFISVVFLNGGAAMAERSKLADQQKTRIMAVPHLLFSNTMRIDIEKKLGNENQWISIGPSLRYRDKRGNWFFGERSIYAQKGIGLDVDYKWFPSSTELPGRIYVFAGAGYNFLSLEKLGNRWLTYSENNLTYFMYDESRWSTHIHSGSFRVGGGIQLFRRNYFVMDYYFGMGMKKSKVSKPGGYIYPSNDVVMTDPEFSGFHVVTGLRIGLGW